MPKFSAHFRSVPAKSDGLPAASPTKNELAASVLLGRYRKGDKDNSAVTNVHTSFESQHL